MPSGTGIAFTLLSLLFAAILWRGRDAGSDGRGWLILRSLLPPALLLACLPGGCANERFDTLRLYARGMAVTQVAMQGGRAQTPAVAGCESYSAAGPPPVFVVGRARGCVDLVVADPGGAELDGAVVRLDHPPGGAPALRLATLAASGGALVAAYDGEDGRAFAGAQPLADGDRVCLARCEAGDAGWWVFDADDGKFSIPTLSEERPLRVREGFYGSLQPYGPTQRIHRLSGVLCRADAYNSADGTCRTPALVDPVRPGTAPVPAQSFVFQRGGWRGHQWFVMLLDPGARLRRGEAAVLAPALTATIPLGEGARRHVAIHALRGGALREIRSFTVSHDLVTEPSTRRAFRLTLDTPELVPIGHCDRPLSRLAVAPDLGSAEAFTIPAFGNRANSVLASAAAGLPLDRFDLCDTTSFAFRAPLDDQAASGPIRRQVDFRVDRMGAPWLLALLAGAVALVIHVAGARAWRRDPVDGLVLAVVQYLLVLRAIIGVDGVFADVALDWRRIYSDVGVAMATLPFALLAVRRRGELGPAAALAAAGFVGLALAALWLWLGPFDLIGRLLAALAVAALVVRAVTGMFGERRSDAASDAASDSAASRWTFSRWTFGRLVLDRPPTFWPILLGVIVGVRILLGVLGFRERVFGIALSAVYVPLLLAVVAAILAQADAAAPERRFRIGIVFLAALAVAVGLVTIVINDVGFAIVHLPPIAGVALWRYHRWRRVAVPDPPRRAAAWHDPLPWVAPAAGLVAGYFLLWGAIAFTPPPADDAPLEQRVEYAVDEQSQNWLRLRAVFAPGQIDRIGNRSAAVQLDQSLLLGDLTGTLLGRGWLNPVDLGTFRYQSTHLSDYLSAAHIMAPFGRAGALALLLVLAAFAAAAVSRRTPTPAAWPQLAGALAAWTLFGAAAYMVLANLLLVPFTGRNIYLLAVSSGGDLIEGLALLLMVRLGLGQGQSPGKSA